MNETIPKYRLHKASGRAVVTLCGRTFYLGIHDTEESRNEYDRRIGEWLGAGRRPYWKPISEVLVSEMVSQFRERVLPEYTDKNGKPTSEVRVFNAAVAELLDLYGGTYAEEFDPRRLAAVVERLIRGDRTRTTINHYLGRIRRLFRWAVVEGMVTPSVSERLGMVDGLRAGRTRAKESQGVKPIEDYIIDLTIDNLDPITADMVRFQRLTGARPGEVCAITWGQIDRSRPVWRFVPTTHKTAHRGKTRVIHIGPKAISILEAHKLRTVGDRIISTEGLSASRPIFLNARGKAPTTDRYRARIQGACLRAGVDPWAPNRLRHTAATEMRAAYGIEATSAVLGHTKLDTTQIYAEQSMQAAEMIATEVG